MSRTIPEPEAGAPAVATHGLTKRYGRETALAYREVCDEARARAAIA